MLTCRQWALFSFILFLFCFPCQHRSDLERSRMTWGYMFNLTITLTQCFPFTVFFLIRWQGLTNSARWWGSFAIVSKVIFFFFCNEFLYHQHLRFSSYFFEFLTWKISDSLVIMDCHKLSQALLHTNLQHWCPHTTPLLLLHRTVGSVARRTSSIFYSPLSIHRF